MKELTVLLSEPGFSLTTLIVKLLKLDPEKTCACRNVFGFTQYQPKQWTKYF